MSEEGEKYTFSYQHFHPVAGEESTEDGFRCERYMRGVTEWKPHERGGATLCYVYADGAVEPFAWGLAFCSIRDGFSYHLGREIARGRALAWIRGISIKRFKGCNLAGPSAPKKFEVDAVYVPA